MDYKIVWTDIAIEDYHRVINYLLDEWNDQVALNFVIKIEDFERQPITTPLSGQITYKDISVRSKLLTKHNKIYYRIVDNEIQILQMRDTRLNPNKNPFE